MSWLEAGSGTVVISFSGDDGDGVIHFDDDALADGPAFEDMQPMLKALRDAGSAKDCAAVLADVNRFSALDLIDSPHWVLLLTAIETAVTSFSSTDSSLCDGLLELVKKLFAAAVEGPLQQAAEVACLACDCSRLVYWCNHGVLWVRASQAMLGRLSRCGGMLVHAHTHTRDHLLLHILRCLLPSGGPCFAYRSAGAALGWLPHPDIDFDDESIDHAAAEAAEQAAGTVVDARTAVGASLHDPFAEDAPFAWLNGWFMRGPWRRQLCRWMEATRAVPLLLCCVLQPQPPPQTPAASDTSDGSATAADAELQPHHPLPLLKLNGGRFIPALDVRWAQSRHALQLLAAFPDTRAMLVRELRALGVLQAAPSAAGVASAAATSTSAYTLVPAETVVDICKAAMKDFHFHKVTTFMPDVLPADAVEDAVGMAAAAAPAPAAAAVGDSPVSLETLQRLTLNNTLRLLCGLPVVDAGDEDADGASGGVAAASGADAAPASSSAFGSLRSKWVQPPTVDYFPCLHIATGSTAVSLCKPGAPVASSFLPLTASSDDCTAAAGPDKYPPLLVPIRLLHDETSTGTDDTLAAADDDVHPDVLRAWLAAL